MFERLTALGNEAFTKIVNQLVRGVPTTEVAHLIQMPPPEGMGVLQDLTENALQLQLRRLRQAVAEGQYGKDYAAQIAAGHQPPQIRLLAKASPQVLQRMEELADWQRERALALKTREAQNLMPQISAKMAPQEYRHILTQTNAVFNDYRDTLVTLQEIRFKLGIDEFKGPVSTLKGAVQKTDYPDGSSVQKQVFEAISVVEDIFNTRRIPKPSRLEP